MLAENPRGLPIDVECKAAVTCAAAILLASLGHHVEPGFPEALTDESFGRQFSALWATNMAVAAQRTAD